MIFGKQKNKQWKYNTGFAHIFNSKVIRKIVRYIIQYEIQFYNGVVELLSDDKILLFMSEIQLGT